MASTLAGFDGPHPDLPADRAETKFDDGKPRYSRAQAMAEAARCLYCYDAPCIEACPTSINIPEFIRKIATDNVKGSARTIFDSNILGMSCARVCPVEVLCVGQCVYNHEDIPPVQIGRLQRYSTDTAYDKGWSLYEPGPDSGKTVALVGAGPASLACAHELRKEGHKTVLLEKRSLPGGLNTTGVAPYKMIADASLAEVAWIVDSMGVEVQTGVEVGKDVSWEKLLADHDAVFVGVGLGPDSSLGVPGEDLGGVFGGVEIIERWKNGGDPATSGVTHAAVVGGGNTALDVVRELLVLGIPCVTMIYRRNEASMTGYEHEWDYAKKGGAGASWHSQPVAYVGEGGKVTGVECHAMEIDPDDPKGRKLRRKGDHSFVVPAELVVVAAGQGKLSGLLEGMPGVDLDWGRIVVDDDGRTSNPKIFAGGDVANGGKEVVNAAAEGKRAAQAIHAALSQ
ncbi:MAG: NAD(P)-dependent oxidoreductase [Proteobacteria bacterium]|nr:NAD(P)-dependent oxidoreductase [Pseudomonadota bacterium]